MEKLAFARAADVRITMLNLKIFHRPCENYIRNMVSVEENTQMMTERKEQKDKIFERRLKTNALKSLNRSTFLQSYCSYCRKSLIERDLLKLKIVSGEEGFLLLSPYLSSFTSKSTIFLPEDKPVTDIQCFHCDASLVDKDKGCDKCGSPTAKINVSASNAVIDFYVCTKKGCAGMG
ncbi:MAG: hypothetical protein MZV63_55915 [Marinilabiliales bacterium]|nr:hypothetical protein [Marinilabiliales bacterium]